MLEPVTNCHSLDTEQVLLQWSNLCIYTWLGIQLVLTLMTETQQRFPRVDLSRNILQKTNRGTSSMCCGDIGLCWNWSFVQLLICVQVTMFRSLCVCVWVAVFRLLCLGHYVWVTVFLLPEFWFLKSPRAPWSYFFLLLRTKPSGSKSHLTRIVLLSRLVWLVSTFECEGKVTTEKFPSSSNLLAC